VSGRISGNCNLARGSPSEFQQVSDWNGATWDEKKEPYDNQNPSSSRNSRENPVHQRATPIGIAAIPIAFAKHTIEVPSAPLVIATPTQRMPVTREHTMNLQADAQRTPWRTLQNGGSTNRHVSPGLYPTCEKLQAKNLVLLEILDRTSSLDVVNNADKGCPVIHHLGSWKHSGIHCRF